MRVILLLILVFAFTSCAPKSFDVEFRDAEAKIGLADYDAALVKYRSIIHHFPDDPRRPDILLRIADLYDTFLNDPELAIEAYGRVINEYPLSSAAVVAHERRAKFYENSGQFDGAIEDYAALIKHFPDNPDADRYRLLLAGAYLAQRNFPQARLEMKPMFDNKNIPKDIYEQLLFAMGESYFLEDKPSEAAPYYQEILKLFPKSKLVSEAELHLASCVEEMGYLGLARDLTKDASRDYPNKKVIDTRLKSLKERGAQPAEKK